MKIHIWAVAFLLLAGAVAPAGGGTRVGERTDASVLAAEDLATETALTSTFAPRETLVATEPSGWLGFHHGYLWSDYCARHADGPAAGQVTDDCRATCPESKAFIPWPRSNGAPQHTCACRHRRSSPLDFLRSLFGWKRRVSYHVACNAAPDSQTQSAPASPDASDLPPAPPVAEPWDEHEGPLGDDAAPIGQGGADPVLLDAAPTPDEIEGPHATPPPAELSPAPADDPAPEPQPEVPHNELPKRVSARPAATRAADGHTVLVGRLSEYIRTR
jgi:hypothetical protein